MRYGLLLLYFCFVVTLIDIAHPGNTVLLMWSMALGFFLWFLAIDIFAEKERMRREAEELARQEEELARMRQDNPNVLFFFPPLDSQSLIVDDYGTTLELDYGEDQEGERQANLDGR